MDWMKWLKNVFFFFFFFQAFFTELHFFSALPMSWASKDWRYPHPNFGIFYSFFSPIIPFSGFLLNLSFSFLLCIFLLLFFLLAANAFCFGCWDRCVMPTFVLFQVGNFTLVISLVVLSVCLFLFSNLLFSPLFHLFNIWRAFLAIHLGRTLLFCFVVVKSHVSQEWVIVHMFSC